ncbi:hypothetical protein J8J04_02520 ['Fragaria x ananassa' phyllody phytoplasma]|uniref:Secreted protein n=1 Tax='Fragaria x ananassa' phyllody phytoplasma TaxID=2358428 RepID=A0ABS5K3Q2_9MOLU|nr:hypothetical protein ['Fragaria x ananassa' phyllody phytoplasma]MBS2126550.1 hypothetical protein ['Fragaria x ananassa' phyllody phytoplasma]
MIQTKTPKKVLLIVISLLIFVLSHKTIYAHNYFHKQTKSKIKFILLLKTVNVN